MKGKFSITLATPILLLLASHLDGQSKPGVHDPPQAMRLCVDKTCLNLKWVEDHYEGYEEDAKATLSWRFG